jgi:hypothetical protein
VTWLVFWSNVISGCVLAWRSVNGLCRALSIKDATTWAVEVVLMVGKRVHILQYIYIYMLAQPNCIPPSVP